MDKGALSDWMKKRGIDYRGLAEVTGMSTTQAYNLVRYGSGGATTIGYLIAAGCPMFLMTYETVGNRKKVVDAQALEVRVR